MIVWGMRLGDPASLLEGSWYLLTKNDCTYYALTGLRHGL